MKHKRSLVLGAAALTTVRCNRHDIEVGTEIMDELEPVIQSERFLEKAPFGWVGLILRYGLKNEDRPHYQRINKKDGDLPVAIELDTHELRDASREELKELFMIAILKTLVDVGKKYKLPHATFEEMLHATQSARAQRLAAEPDNHSDADN